MVIRSPDDTLTKTGGTREGSLLLVGFGRRSELGLVCKGNKQYASGMDVDGTIRKRCQRFNAPWDAHELTFSCYRGREFLSRDRTRLYFVEAVNKAREKHVFDVWAYVIMLEHVHLLIWPREETYSISVTPYLGGIGGK